MKPISIIVERETAKRKEREALEEEQYQQRERDIAAGRREEWNGMAAFCQFWRIKQMKMTTIINGYVFKCVIRDNKVILTGRA